MRARAGWRTFRVMPRDLQAAKLSESFAEFLCRLKRARRIQGPLEYFVAFLGKSRERRVAHRRSTGPAQGEWRERAAEKLVDDRCECLDVAGAGVAAFRAAVRTADHRLS